jgi:hypothetical protein
MDPDANAVVATIERYAAALTASRTDEVAALFSPHGEVRDPVDSSPVRGREAIRSFFDGVVGMIDRLTTSGPVRVSADGRWAAAPMRADATVDGNRLRVDTVDVFHFDDQGYIVAMHAHYGPVNARPLESVAPPEYDGHLLNHVEILYRPGERQLAIRFFELLGCTVVDTAADAGTGSTILFVYPEAGWQDRLNNVLYLSEVRQPQRRLEAVLGSRLQTDGELREALAAYDHKARHHPHGTTHFGLRYPTFEALEAVIRRLGPDLPAELAGRVSVDPVPPGDPRSMTDELLQAFVRTDVVCAGLFTFGQLIELQAQRRATA